jgi:diaminopimelate decarboxylase
MSFSDKDIAQFAHFETPFYYYDLALLQKTLDSCAVAAKVHGYHVHYAMKANFNPRIVERIRAAGFGADAVSGGEVKQAVALGFDAGKIVFAGVGKSDREINYALDQNIFCFNVESIQELEVIDELGQCRHPHQSKCRCAYAPQHHHRTG